MKAILSSIFILTLTFTAPVHSNDFFDDFDEEMKEFESPDSEKIIQEYIAFVNEYLTEYDTWRHEYLNGFDNKQAKIINRWGQPTNQEITNVAYSENLNARETIDYEKNEVVVEILVPISTTENENTEIITKHITNNAEKDSLIPAESSNKGIDTSKVEVHSVKFTQAQEKVAKEVIKTQTVAYKKEAEIKADKLQETQEAIPQEVVALSVKKQKEALEKEEQARLAKVEAQYAELRKEKEKQPPKYKILKYTVKLPSNSLSKRAKKYTNFAEKESQRFDIPVALIMAIMHSESAFDPKAKSAVPAYGLMQIVPRTAGHDVNKMVRKIDKPMKAKDLYVPDINVETGSAYLSILDKRYLKSIKNPKSRLYCTIAAYNTGAGNVAKVFNKKGQGNVRNINRAAKVINTLSPNEVYSALVNNLPYDETKHYLKKVSKRIALYEVKTEI